MTDISNTRSKKYSWIDVIRTIGAFFIILIHVSDTYLDLSKSIDLVNWTSVVFWNSIPRTGVPLFIAVSGIFILIQTFSIILLISRSEQNIYEIFNRFVFLRKIVEISSRHALGIYAIHYFFVKLIFYAVDRSTWQQQSHNFIWILIIVISISVWLLSLLVSIAASKNNFLRRVF